MDFSEDNLEDAFNKLTQTQEIDSILVDGDKEKIVIGTYLSLYFINKKSNI